MVSILDEFKRLNIKYQHTLSCIILTLISVSFTVTDWLIGIFTFSDYIFGITLLLLLVSGNFKFKRSQIGWAILLLVLLTSNILLNYLYNDAFILKTGLAALIKVAFYTIVIIGEYNYVKYWNLEAKLLNTIVIVAVFVCVIGIYITIALYSDVLPYDFFWKFTRNDLASYTYGWNESLIRTRSIFAEPSYLGYYLNIILGMIYFNKQIIKIHKYVIYLILLTIVLTFSYSSIGVMLFILIIYFLHNKKYKDLKWDNRYYIVLVFVLLFLYVFRDLINQTIIQRTISILNGTDTSALNRILSSWKYININNIFMGNGINHTPDIWNNYAYVLSDLGLITFIGSIIFSGYLLMKNLPLGLLFIVLNFQKGGYLSNSFWIFLLLILIYSNNTWITKPFRTEKKTLNLLKSNIRR